MALITVSVIFFVMSSSDGRNGCLPVFWRFAGRDGVAFESFLSGAYGQSPIRWSQDLQ